MFENDHITYSLDEDEKLHVHLRGDVVFHFWGNREQIVHGNDVELSKNKVTVAAGVYHVQPTATADIRTMVTNGTVLDVIEEKTKTVYARAGRMDYKRVGHNKMFNRRLMNASCKGKCKC